MQNNQITSTRSRSFFSLLLLSSFYSVKCYIRYNIKGILQIKRTKLISRRLNYGVSPVIQFYFESIKCPKRTHLMKRFAISIFIPWNMELDFFVVGWFLLCNHLTHAYLNIKRITRVFFVLLFSQCYSEQPLG